MAASGRSGYFGNESQEEGPQVAGVSHRLLVRYHDGIMAACRLHCIDLEGEVARCKELGELLATEQRAPMAVMTRWGLFKSPGDRAARPAPRLGAWDVPLHWGGGGALRGGTRGARLGGSARWSSKGQMAVCLALCSCTVCTSLPRDSPAAQQLAAAAAAAAKQIMGLGPGIRHSPGQHLSL
jgi:hypothetical protein